MTTRRSGRPRCSPDHAEIEAIAAKLTGANCGVLRASTSVEQTILGAFDDGGGCTMRDVGVFDRAAP